MNIAILSRNPNLYSTKRLLEAAQERGHEARVVDYLKCSFQIEQEGPSMYYQGEKLQPDAVIPRIGASRTFFGTAVVRQFEMLETFSVNPSLAISRSRDKLRSLQILSKHGIGMPKTVFASNTSDVDDVIKQIGGTPLVIKVLEGTQGVGVVLAETKKAAKSVLEAFYGMQVNLLVQEFIAEAGGSDIRAFVVNGKVVGAMKRQGNEEDFRSNLHRGGSAMRTRLSREESNTALAAARIMGLKMAGVDMLRSHRGPLVMEVNSSPGLEGIEKATEKDVAGEVIKYIEASLGKARKKKVEA